MLNPRILANRDPLPIFVIDYAFKSSLFHTNPPQVK